MTIGDIFLKLLADDSGFAADVEKKAGEAGAKGGQTMSQQIGQAAKKNVSKITAGAGAVVGAFVAGSVQQFADFQQGMNEVFTLLPGITQDAMGKMSEDVKAFSRETGKLPEEVIPALYSALSAGVPPDNVFEFMRTANKAAVGGVSTTTDAIGLLSAVTKGYGDTSEEATKKASDLAFTTVKLGQTTFPELSAAIGKAVPLAASLNLRQEELFASAATLTGVTGNTAEVMTQLKAVFTALIKTNPNMAAGLKEMGYESGAAAIEALGLKGTLDGLQKVTGGNTQKLAEMLGSSEALTATLAITGAQSEKFTDNLAEMEGAAGATDAAYKTMDSGIKATSNRILANIKTMALGIGEQLAGLGPIFTLFGPTAGRAIGAALGGAFGFIAPKIAGLGVKIATGLASALASSTFAQTVSTGLAKTVGAAFTALPGSALIKGTITRVGLVLGSATSLAIAAGMVALGAAIALAFKSIFLDPALQAQTQQIGKDVAAQITQGTLDQLKQSKAAIEKGIADIQNLPLGGFLYGDQIAALQGQLDAVNAEIEARAGKTGDAVADGLEAGQAAVDKAAQELVDGIPDAAAAAATDAGKEAAKTPQEIADGIQSKRDLVKGAMSKLRELLSDEMSPAKERARVIGELTSKELAKGLRSKDPVVKQAAENAKAILLQRLDELPVGSKGLGEKTGAALAKALKSKDPLVREAARQIQKTIQGQMDKVDGAKAGRQIDNEIVTGLRQNSGKISDAAYKIGIRITKAIIAGVGGTQGPKSGGATKATKKAAGGPVYAGEAYIVGEHRPELFVPSTDGTIVPNLEHAMIGDGGGGGTNINLQTYGLPMRAETPAEVVHRVRRAARLRTIVPPRTAPAWRPT